MIGADIITHLAANMPADDTSLAGGAIDTNGLVTFTDLAANDTLEAVSDNAADTMTLTIDGRDAGRALVSEAIALNGTTVVPFPTNTLERFISAVLASAPAGNVTIRRSGAGATVATITPGATTVRRLFVDSVSEGTATTRYAKVFLRNTHGVDTANSATVTLTADPSSVIRIGLAPTKGDSVTIANRKTAPASVTFVDDGIALPVPTNVLAAGENIGVYAAMDLGINNIAIKDTFTIQLSAASG